MNQVDTAFVPLEKRTQLIWKHRRHLPDVPTFIRPRTSVPYSFEAQFAIRGVLAIFLNTIGSKLPVVLDVEE